MSSRIPSYLRVHQADTDPVAPTLDEVTEVAHVLQAVTGWCVQVQDFRQEGPLQTTPESSESSESSESAAAAEGDVLQLFGPATAQPPLPEVQAAELVGAVNRLCAELRATRRALWEREAELAAGVPVTPRPDEQSHLAERLQAILQGGAEAVGAQAAAIYLLNEDTSQLKYRAGWGLPADRLTAPARPLRGAVADLEALIGHAVVLEDTQALSHWKVPEDFPSAICVPIASPTSPLGTLWVFSSEQRDFTAEQTNLIEIVAGRVASDLDREVLLQQGVHSQDLRRQLDLVAVAQYDRLPQMPPLLDGWELAGWSVPTDSICGDFYYWSELPDGQLAVAVADAMANGLEAAVACSNLHSALHAHVCYRHDARQMLARLNETLWTSSAGDQFASLTYLLIDPEAGRLQLAQAGKTALLLSTSPQPLLGSAPPLGTQPEDTYQVTRDHLPRGGVLLLASEGLLPLLERSGRRRSPLSQLLQDTAPTTTASEIAESVRSLMLAKLGSPVRDATLVVVRREP